ncbi:YLP motif-containing protein 1 [Dendrobates tinctorius]|uniref:YLP motif-containing protein 1 n=1 Tax=Dendrobates tinctorius TaxID=92724 RepID=UPI003CC9CBE7
MYPVWPPRYGGPSAPPAPVGPPAGPAFQSFRDQHLAQLEQLQRMHQRQLESVLPAGPPPAPRHYYSPPRPPAAAFPFPPPPPYGHGVPPPDYQQPAAPPPPPEPEQPPPPPAPEQPPPPPPLPGSEGNPGDKKNLEEEQQFYYQQHLLSLQQKAKRSAKEMVASAADSPQDVLHSSAGYAPPPPLQEPPPLDEGLPPPQDSTPSMNLTEDPEQAQRLKTLQEAAAHWQQHEQHRLGFQYQGIIQKHSTLQQLLQRSQQLLAEPPHLAAMSVDVQLQHHEMQQKQFLPLHQEWESQFKKWQELLQTYPHKDQLQDYHVQWTSWQAHMKATKSQLKDKITSLKGLKQQFGGNHYIAVVPPQYPTYSAVMPPAVPPAVPPGLNIPPPFSAPGPPMYSTVPPPPLPTAPAAAFSEVAPPLPPVSAPPLPPATSAPPPPPPDNTASMEAVPPPLPPENTSGTEVPPLPEMTSSTVSQLVPPPAVDSSAHSPVNADTCENIIPPSGLSYQAQQALKYAALAKNSPSFPAHKPPQQKSIAHVGSSQLSEECPDPKDNAKPLVFPSSPSKLAEKETVPPIPQTIHPMNMAGPRFPTPGYETPRFSVPRGGMFPGSMGPLGFRDPRPLLGGKHFHGSSFHSANDAFQGQKPASTLEQRAESAPDPGDCDRSMQSSEPVLQMLTPHKQAWEQGQRHADKWDKCQGELPGKKWDEQHHVSANRWDQPEEPQTWDRPTESSWDKSDRHKWDVKDKYFSSGTSRSQENADIMESPEGSADTPAQQVLERAEAFPRDMRKKHETPQPDRPDSQREGISNKWGDPQGYSWSASDSPHDSWFGPNRQAQDKWSIAENTEDLRSDAGASRNNVGPPLDKFIPFQGPNRFRFGAPEMPPRGRARFPGEPQRSRFTGPAGFSRERFSSPEGLPRDRYGEAESGHRHQFSSTEDQPKHLYEGTSFPTHKTRFDCPNLPPDRFRALEAPPTMGPFRTDSTSHVKWGFSEERERFDVDSSQDGWTGKRAPYKGSDRPEWQSEGGMAESVPPLPMSDPANKHVDERWNRQVGSDAMGGRQGGKFGFAPEHEQSSQSLPLDNRDRKETPLDGKKKSDEQNASTALPAPFLGPIAVGSEVFSADSEKTDLCGEMEKYDKSTKDHSLNKEIISKVPTPPQMAGPASPVEERAAETTNSSLHKTEAIPTMQSGPSSEKSLPGLDTKMGLISEATVKNAEKLNALQESPPTCSSKEPTASDSGVLRLEATKPNVPGDLITNPSSLTKPDETQGSPDNCPGPPTPAGTVHQLAFSSRSAVSPTPTIRPGAPCVATPGAQVVSSVRPIAPRATFPFRPGVPQNAGPVRSGALLGPPPIRPSVPRASPPVRSGAPRPPPPARPSFPWASPSIRQGIPHVRPGQVRAACPVRPGAPRMPLPVRPVDFHPPVSDEDFSEDIPPDEEDVYEHPINVDPRAQSFYKGADLGKSLTEPQIPSDHEHFMERKPFSRMSGPEGHRGHMRQPFPNQDLGIAESRIHPEARPCNYSDYELSGEPEYYPSDFSLEGPRRGNINPRYNHLSRGRSRGFIRDRLPPRPGRRDVLDFPIERDFEPRAPFLEDKVLFREGPDKSPQYDRETFRGEPMPFERERFLDPLLNNGRRDHPGEELRSEDWESDRYWHDEEQEFSRDPYFREDRLPVSGPPLPSDVRCDPWHRESGLDREGYYDRAERRYLHDDDDDDQNFLRIPVDPDITHRERDWLPSRRSLSPHRPFSPGQPRSSLPPLPPLDNYREERWRLERDLSDRDFHERTEPRIREYSDVPSWREDRKHEFLESPNLDPREDQWIPSDRALGEGLNVLPAQSTGPDSEPAGHGMVALSQRQHEIILKAAQELKMLREQKEQLDNLKNFFSSSNPSDTLNPVPATQQEVLQVPSGSLDKVEGAATSTLASSVRGAAEHWDEDSFSGLWDEERQVGRSANLPVGSKLPGIQQTVDYAHGKDLTVGKVEQMPYGERVVLPEPALERGSSSFPTDYLIDCYDRDLRDQDPYFERQSNKHLDRRGYERERERDRDRLDSHRDRGDHDRERFDRDRHSREERLSSYRDKETTNRRSGSDKPSYERKPERSSFEAPAPAFGATRRPYPEERPLLPTPVPVPPPEKKPEIKNVDDLLKKPGRGNRPDRIVVIMRGLPGSGKTHVAKLIRDKEVEYGGSAPRVLSLDDYFMTEVEKVEKDPESGRKVIKKVMEYEYEPDMEDTYRCGMLKTFKKTLDDGFFPFIILDSIHDRVRHFEQFWSAAKTKGFEVYLAEITADTQTCAKRNVHSRKLKDLNKMADNWEAAPRHMIRLDIRSLLQDAAIEEVEMEDSEPSADPEQEVKKELEEEESERGYLPKSKWEMDTSEAKLDKLDGLKTRKRDWQSMAGCMEDYLQLPDDYDTRESEPGKKRVRWADLEEKKDADRKRAIGFIVGQTDWEKITDKSGHLAERALNRTKYI